jgi:hypothetical protein
MALQRVFMGGMGGSPHVAKRNGLRGTRRAYSATKTTTACNMPLRARRVLVGPFAGVVLASSTTLPRALRTTSALAFQINSGETGPFQGRCVSTTRDGPLFLDTCN